jgi:hypothetical protein
MRPKIGPKISTISNIPIHKPPPFLSIFKKTTNKPKTFIPTTARPIHVNAVAFPFRMFRQSRVSFASVSGKTTFL